MTTTIKMTMQLSDSAIEALESLKSDAVFVMAPVKGQGLTFDLREPVDGDSRNAFVDAEISKSYHKRTVKLFDFKGHLLYTGHFFND